MHYAELSDDEEKQKFKSWEEEYHHKNFSKKYAQSFMEQQNGDFANLRFITDLKKIYLESIVHFHLDYNDKYTLEVDTNTWSKVPKKELKPFTEEDFKYFMTNRKREC